LSRMINPETAGKDRLQIQRGIILAIRELMGQSEIDSTTYDLAAFIAISLGAIECTIETSVAPWEKRGYWLKADRFRQDWSWVSSCGQKLRNAIRDENWPDIAGVVAQVAGKLDKVKVPVRHKLGTPWVGAWEKLSHGKEV